MVPQIELPRRRSIVSVDVPAMKLSCFAARPRLVLLPLRAVAASAAVTA
jgi:hypothetical protein